MRYENLEPLTIALYLEQLGFDHDLVGQFREGIDRTTKVMDDYERRMAEIKTGKHQSDAERDALAQGLTEKTVRRLEGEKTRLAGYDQHMVGVAVLSENKAGRAQMELQQIREAHEEAVDAAINVVRPQEDMLVQLAR